MERSRTHAGDDQLILALAHGAKVRHAADHAGVSERTVYRRRKDANFLRAVNEAHRRVLDANRGRLAGLADQAVATLERLMESEKPAVALAAAKAILELGQRLGQSTEQEEQINLLEDQADENSDGNQTPADEEELVLALGLEYGPSKIGVLPPAVGGSFRDARLLGGMPHFGAGGQRQNQSIIAHERTIVSHSGPPNFFSPCPPVLDSSLCITREGFWSIHVFYMGGRFNQSLRLFSETSPSARTSKGFLTYWHCFMVDYWVIYLVQTDG